MAAIFVLSNRPTLPDLPGGLTSYTGHFIGYALLGGLVLRGFAGGRWSGVTVRSGLMAVAFSSVYGLSDEFHQSYVPGRSPSVSDWIVDTIGAAAAVLVLSWLARVRSTGRTAL